MMENEQTTKQVKKTGKANLNFAIDFLALISMLLMIGTGLTIKYILPAGSGGRGGGRGSLLWGMDRHGWGDVHFWISIVIIGLMALHVALHWAWICNYVRRHLVRKTHPTKISRRASLVFGVGFIFLLNGLIMWFMWASNSSVFVTADNHDGHKQWRHDSSEQEREENLNNAKHKSQRMHRHTAIGNANSIRGYMTLDEVSKKTGVPIDDLKASLNLPGRVSSKKRLGMLRRLHGLQIEDVRKIVSSYQKIRNTGL